MRGNAEFKSMSFDESGYVNNAYDEGIITKDYGAELNSAFEDDIECKATMGKVTNAIKKVQGKIDRDGASPNSLFAIERLKKMRETATPDPIKGRVIHPAIPVVGGATVLGGGLAGYNKYTTGSVTGKKERENI